MRLLDRNIPLVLVLGLALGGLYFMAIDLQAPGFSLEQQQHVISGAAGSPYRYRVLVPFLLEGVSRVFMALGHPENVAYLDASATYDCVGLMLQLLVLYALFRQWFSALQSLVGVAFTSGITLATFAYFTYQPWSILEVTLFSLGFLLAYQQRWWATTIVVILASLNRETGIFLPMALLLGSIDLPRPLSMAALRSVAAPRETQLKFALVVLSTLIFAGLRLARGSAPPVDQLGDVITRNLLIDNLFAAALAVPLVFGLGWIFALLGGLSNGPQFIRRLARVVPLYLAAFAIWGWWREVRILTSLYPTVLPLVLGYCYLPRKTD